MIKGKVFLLTIVFFTVISFGIFAGGTQEQPEAEDSSAATIEPAADSDTIEPLNVTIATLKGPSGMAAAKMVDENFQPGSNVNASYIVLSSPLEAVSKMTSGEIDAAFLPVNTAAKLYTKGLKFRLAAVTGRGSLYMLSTSEAAEGWDSLKGKTIYLTGKGATPDYLLRYLLINNGLDPETDVNLDFTSTPAQIVQLLAAGKADTAFIPQPFAMLAGVKAKAKTIIDPQKELMKIRGTEKAFPFTAFVLSERFINSNPEAASSVLEELSTSINWVKTNPEEASIVIEKIGILGAAVAKPAIPVSGIKFISAEESEADVMDFLQMLNELDPVSVGGKLPDEGFFFKS
ncbi:MAG: ABC transporter substrate-binding protein [Spirochaetales bacterium]|nr:ABC transporter substrate-binding protein [Spirochaetales bacterium]